MRLLALLLMMLLPVLLVGQDTIVPGTFTVRKVYQGDFIPDGLGVFGNMGGVSNVVNNDKGADATKYVIIKGRALTIMGNDSTPIRSANVQVIGSNVNVSTDEKGYFDLSLFPNFKAEGDSMDLHFTHFSGWDTTVTVPFANDSSIEVSRRVAPSASTMTRKQRRREVLKRIFLPWVWFQKKEKLPSRERNNSFTKGGSASSAAIKKPVLSQVGD